MTITSTTARNDYSAIVFVGTYAYTFRILDEDDLEVIVRDAETGVETVKVRGLDYNVTGVGQDAGGNVVFTATGQPDTDDHITIRRNPSFTQETDIRNQGRYFPDLHEDAFDAAAMRDQYLKGLYESALRLPVTVDPGDVSVYLPVPEANQYLAWNNDGSALENKATTDGGITQTAADVRYALRTEPITDLGNMGSAKTATWTASANRFKGSLNATPCALTLSDIPDNGYMELHLDTAVASAALTWAAPAGQTIQHMSGAGVAPVLPSASGQSVSFVVERVGTKLKVYQTGADA